MIPIIFIGYIDKVLFVAFEIGTENGHSKRDISFGKKSFITVESNPGVKKFTG